MNSPLSERQARRVQETKDRIIKAMRDYLAESSSPDITVEELCERADVARKTFYNHYSSINQLQLELVGEYVLSDYLGRERSNQLGGNFIEKYTRYCADILSRETFFLTTYHGNLMRIGIEAYFQQSKESAEMLQTVQQAFLVDWLQQDMAAGGWSMSLSPSVFFEFHGGMQTGSTVHVAYEHEYNFRNQLFDLQDLMQRYIARKQQEKQP